MITKPEYSDKCHSDLKSWIFSCPVRFLVTLYLLKTIRACFYGSSLSTPMPWQRDACYNQTTTSMFASFSILHVCITSGTCAFFFYFEVCKTNKQKHYQKYSVFVYKVMMAKCKPGNLVTTNRNCHFFSLPVVILCFPHWRGRCEQCNSSSENGKGEDGVVSFPNNHVEVSKWLLRHL